MVIKYLLVLLPLHLQKFVSLEPLVTEYSAMHHREANTMVNQMGFSCANWNAIRFIKMPFKCFHDYKMATISKKSDPISHHSSGEPTAVM